MRFPKPTKVIEPTVEPQPEVIYLRHVERARPQPQRLEEDERVYQAPVFILPLKGSYYSNEWPLERRHFWFTALTRCGPDRGTARLLRSQNQSGR